MTYSDFQREPFTPFDVLDKLIRAGLGDVPQGQITRAQFERAMGRKRIPNKLGNPQQQAQQIHIPPVPIPRPVHRYAECSLGMGCVCREVR